MIKNNTFQEIAKNEGQAINGLQPKISLWSQRNRVDGDHESSGAAMKGIAGVYSMLPPLLNTVHEPDRDASTTLVWFLPEGKGV